MLAQTDVDVNAKNKNGHTPLSVAVYIGAVYSLQKLLADPRTDVNTKNKGTSLLTQAVTKGFSRARGLKLLLLDTRLDIDNDEKNCLLQTAVENKDFDTVTVLINDTRFEVNHVGQNGESPFFLAVKTKHSDDIVRCLLTSPKLDVNLASRNGKQDTPLFTAIAMQNYNVVEMLLADPRTDVNKCNLDKESPLFAAVRLPYNTYLKLLLNYRVNVNQANSNGITPLMLACEKNDEEAVTCVLYPKTVLKTLKNGLQEMAIATILSNSATEAPLTKDVLTLFVFNYLFPSKTNAKLVARDGRTALSIALSVENINNNIITMLEDYIKRYN